MSPTRAEARARMEDRILDAGRDQLRERGAAALSLREVARSLGVVSSAVYRYVASRDDLLTLLLVDAYTDLADSVDAALDGSAAVRSARERFAAFAGAMRTWALRNPERWALLYGSPVPGYAAPHERTDAAGTRVMSRLLVIAAEGSPAGADTDVPDGLRSYLCTGASDLGVEVSAASGARAVEAWCAIIGTISTEIFGQLGPIDEATGSALLARTITTQAALLGLP
ncbi:TetR/AcrR family transcriptional regulator [Brachybacterium huguangmaarense]